MEPSENYPGRKVRSLYSCFFWLLHPSARPFLLQRWRSQHASITIAKISWTCSHSPYHNQCTFSLACWIVEWQENWNLDYYSERSSYRFWKNLTPEGNRRRSYASLSSTCYAACYWRRNGYDGYNLQHGYHQSATSGTNYISTYYFLFILSI